MLDFNIPILPWIVLAIINFFTGWVYYSPPMPWFQVWARTLGFDPNKPMSEEDKKAMPRLMGGAVVASFLTAFGFVFLVRNLPVHTFFSGAIVGLVVWLAFVVSSSLNTQFEGRKPIILIINNGHYVVIYTIFGGIAAIWR